MKKVFEIQRIRQVKTKKEVSERFVARSPEAIAEYAAEYIGDEDREVLLVMMLNTKNEVIGLHRCHVGSINSSVVAGREIFKGAILNNAGQILICHNHPSGSPAPSLQDKEITRVIHRGSEALSIDLLDHVIVTDDPSRYFSFMEHFQSFHNIV